MKKILATALIATAALYAGGAADLVGKKSNAKGYTYSLSTRFDFLQDCSKNANQEVCSCVLDKLQLQYSEKDYLKLDADLRKNVDRPEFVAYISKAASDCDAETNSTAAENNEVPAAPTAPAIAITEEDAKAFVKSMLKNRPKKDFVPACAAEAKTFYGDKLAKKVCGCAYDHMAADLPRFTKMVMEEGYPDETLAWGLEYMVECSPDKFTPEMEKSLLEFMNQQGLPKSFGKCLIGILKKEYSVKAFLTAAVQNNEALGAIFASMATRCLLENQ